MILALALTAWTRAAEPEPAEVPAAPEPTASAEADVLAGAEVLAQRDPRLGLSVLEYLARSGPEASQGAVALAIDRVPQAGIEWEAAARLVGWQTVVGAWTLGPGVALSTRRWVHPSITTTGMGLGAVIGAGTALWYARRPGFTPTRASTVITSQQLGIWHGIVASVLLHSTRFEEAPGATAGLGVGIVGGYLLAEVAHLDDDGVPGAWHGALWGTGTAWLGMNILQAQVDDHWRTQWTVLLLGTDLGVVGGYALASALDLDRLDLTITDLGIAAGVGLGALVLVANPNVDWSGPGSAAALLIGGLGGGAAALFGGRALRKVVDGRFASNVVLLPPSLAMTWRDGAPTARLDALRFVF